MTQVRIKVPGAFSTAFTPMPHKAAPIGGQAYKMYVEGQPGTQGIPAPYPGVPEEIDRVGSDHRSVDAPPVWYPSEYYELHIPVYEGAPFAGGAWIYSDNQLPIPAIEPQRGTYHFGGGKVVQPDQRKKRPWRLGGQRQVRQDTAMPRWANWHGR